MVGLFEGLPDQAAPSAGIASGKARLRVPSRDSVSLEVLDLDGLIEADHPARAMWAYAERVDFSAFEALVKAREGGLGQARTAPHLLLALWLYATSEGVGSAREVARLCSIAPAYRWLCGGVSVNHHALSDFRNDPSVSSEDLLTKHVASLSLCGLIDLDEIAQDGVRVRANAGAASFRRRKTLEGELAEARTVLERLAKDEEDDPGGSGRRRKARRESAARDRLARVEQALEAMNRIEARREKRGRGDARSLDESAAENAAETADEPTEETAGRTKETRASTTDPQARVMKMADGGFRPAYNVQIASLPESGLVLAVQVGDVGSDRGLAEPMAATIKRRYGRRAERYLVDGGFQCADDIEAAHAAGTAFYCPPGRAKAGGDPHRVRKTDGPGVAQWRTRMATQPAKDLYKRRSRCELIHAHLRNLDLDRLRVRGMHKVQAWMAGFALVMNILTEGRLRAAIAA